ncbi:hypothetical protein FJZ39_03220 [Candidatus Saccharibacteria bacterium]|nr:hypothetical protein [Candidatus Saccharibacteria bacterium]
MSIQRRLSQPHNNRKPFHSSGYIDPAKINAIGSSAHGIQPRSNRPQNSRIHGAPRVGSYRQSIIGSTHFTAIDGISRPIHNEHTHRHGAKRHAGDDSHLTPTPQVKKESRTHRFMRGRGSTHGPNNEQVHRSVDGIKGVAPRHTFTEPKSRGFNPYA